MSSEDMLGHSEITISGSYFLIYSIRIDFSSGFYSGFSSSFSSGFSPNFSYGSL